DVLTIIGTSANIDDPDKHGIGTHSMNLVFIGSGHLIVRTKCISRGPVLQKIKSKTANKLFFTILNYFNYE
ncbi:MAG TPA: hypothetical protein VFF57_01400, partial [Hanamia sp.]|nr:hypothetical protein [Hanamia sp.]